MNCVSHWDTQLEIKRLYRTLSQPLLLTLVLSVVLHALWLIPVQAPAMRLMNSAHAQSQPVSISFAAAPEARTAEPVVRETEAVEAPLADVEPTPAPVPIPKHELPEVLSSKLIEQVVAAPVAVEPFVEEKKATEQSVEQLQVASVSQAAPTLPDDRQLPVITEPSFRARPQPPVYPKLALKRRWQGQALVQALVNEQGETERVELVGSSGYELLDQSALKAVSGWRFAAAEEGARQVRAWVRVPVNFTIR